jgi:hypothetical protein
MERVAAQVDCGKLGIGDFDAFGIFVLVQFGAHCESGLGRGRCDQLDDGPIAAQWLASTVDGDGPCLVR